MAVPLWLALIGPALFFLRVGPDFLVSVLVLALLAAVRAPRAVQLAQLAWTGALGALAALNLSAVLLGGLDCSVPINVREPGQEVQRLRPNAQADCHLHRAFDYRITIDGNGRRVVPGAPAEGNPVLFLGCSYTTGVGVADGDAFVSVAQKELGPRYRVVNAGMPGIGPNTVLRQLERSELYLRGLPARIPVGVFTFFPDHIARVAGLGSWGLDDIPEVVPDYRLENGQLRYAGSIGHRPVPRFLARKFSPPFVKKLAYYYGIYDHFRRVRRPSYYTEDELALTLAVVRRLPEEFRAKFGGELVLNVWPAHPLHEQLERIGFYEQLRAAYPRHLQYPRPGELRFFPHDRHPDTDTHRRMGQFLARELLPVVKKTP